MIRKFAWIAGVGALMMVAVPAFAQDLPLIGQLPVIGGGGLDLDPLHIFTPAPAAAPAAPAAAAKGAKMHHHHHHMAHKSMKKHAMMKKKAMKK